MILSVACCDTIRRHQDQGQANQMRQFRIIISAGLLLLATTFVFRAPSAQQPTNKIPISGLHNEVIVRRDERGIPYIEAKNDEDLYFAQG